MMESICAVIYTVKKARCQRASVGLFVIFKKVEGRQQTNHIGSFYQKL